MPQGHSRFGGFMLAGIFLANLSVEVLLLGADWGLWGASDWRGRAYELAGFRRELLLGEPALFLGQPIAMFLSYSFLHVGFWHLAGNLLALGSLGPAVLAHFGAGRTLAAYLAAAVAGAFCFALLPSQTGAMVGASGAIFGLAGVLAPRRLDRFWRMVATLILLNIVIWALTGGILAWQTHLGGFLVGLALGRLGPDLDG